MRAYHQWAAAVLWPAALLPAGCRPAGPAASQPPPSAVCGQDLHTPFRAALPAGADCDDAGAAGGESRDGGPYTLHQERLYHVGGCPPAEFLAAVDRFAAALEARCRELGAPLVPAAADRTAAGSARTYDYAIRGRAGRVTIQAAVQERMPGYPYFARVRIEEAADPLPDPPARP